VRLIRWLLRLWRRFFLRPPGKVRQLRAEVLEMSNVRLTWTLPTPTPSQRPVQGVRIEINADPATLPWTTQDTIPVTDPQELLFVDVAAGTQHYRAIVIDDAGAEGAPVETSVDVPFEPPGQVSELTATIE
jgi:hypothetical protein